MNLAPAVSQALHKVMERLQDAEVEWLVGGSCGLMLQQVHISNSPRDLDIYIDVEQVPCFYNRMSDYASDEPQFSETAIYTSILSHYEVAGIQVELVGGFRVLSCDSEYRVSINGLLRKHAVQGGADNRFFLMPLAHELVFNLLRSRPDRYEAIAKTMRANIGAHLPVLREIIEQNSFHPTLQEQLGRLLHTSFQ